MQLTARLRSLLPGSQKVSGSRKYTRSTGGNILMGALLILTGVFLALPLVYGVLTSLKPFDEIFIFPPRFFVARPTLDNFTDLFIMCANSWVPFNRYVFNSVFVAVSATSLHVIFASMCAYPLAKNQFPGRNAVFSIVVLSLMFVPQVTFLPQYIIIARMGLIDTYFALVLPALGSALGVFLMKQFMEQLPTPVLEAARIDGLNEFRIFFRIVMPNVKPAWLTLIIFTFQAVWNNSSTQQFVFREELRTLPSVMQQIVAGNVIARMGVSAAASVFLMVPPIVLFIVLQRSVVETMAYAAIKE